MSDIKKFVKSVVREVLKTEYPGMNAKSELAKVKDVRKEENKFYYTVRPLDIQENEDMTRSELPGIASDQEYHTDDMVVIQYIAGTKPYIIGRWLT